MAAFPALPLAAAPVVISFPRTGFPVRMILWSGLTQEFCVRLKGERPASAGSGQELPHVCKKSYQSPGKRGCTGNGVSVVWDVVNGGSGTSFLVVYGLSPGSGSCDSHAGLVPGIGGWARGAGETSGGV